MNPPVRLAVAGAGAIGRRHMAAIGAVPGAVLVGVADPAPAAAEHCRALGVPHFASLAALFDEAQPDGLIVATPNRAHAGGALAAIAARVPVLVEKPLVDDVAEGVALLEAAGRAGVPLLVGHHRRHDAVMAAARERIAAGDIGRIVTLHASAWLMKPDDYFSVAWRREPGGGPTLLNLIHDIDLMRWFAGDIAAVSAFGTNMVRGNQVEDAAAIAVRFASGAVGTLSVTDSVPAPWSYELTAGENPAYPVTGAAAYHIGGTQGSLELPGLRLWHYTGAHSWFEPLSRTSLPAGPRLDPLQKQIANFVAVIEGREEPVVSGADGLKALAVVDAIARARESGTAQAPLF